MKIYVSSTFQDLRGHRAAVDLALRRMGHDVIGMEQYVAEGTTPLEKCLSDVRSSDAYVLILGWRYGFRPDNRRHNPERRSITELEYREAIRTDRTVLAFLLDPDAPWPPSAFDALGAGGGQDILRFRSDVGAAHLGGVFRTPDELAGQVAIAVSNLRMNRRMVDHALTQTTVGASMFPFLQGEELFDTTVGGVVEMVQGAGDIRALVLNLGAGNAWWSTRLYLLSLLLQTLTPVRQLAFTRADGSFAAMASVGAVRRGLIDSVPELAEFDARSAEGRTLDAQRETERVTTAWQLEVRPTEALFKVGVRPQLLSSWVGEGLVTRCITVLGETGLTMIHVQQIVESFVPDVPVDWPTTGDPASPEPADRHRLMIIDRDSFALELARQWVQAGIPRAPIR